jgi:hypothetical protein
MLMQFVALPLSRLEEDWHIRLIKVWEILAQEGWLAIMCALVPRRSNQHFPKPHICRACCLHLEVLRTLLRGLRHPTRSNADQAEHIRQYTSSSNIDLVAKKNFRGKALPTSISTC